MPRPTTKNDLMIVAKESYEKLNLLISKMTSEELNTPFDFSKDKKKKEAVEIKNNAESLVYQTEKTLKDLEGKLSEDEKSAVNAKLEELKTALTTDNTEDIKAKNDALTQEFYKLSEKLYQNANPMYGYIEQFRDIILYARFPNLETILIGFITALIVLYLGAWYFNKKQDEFILYI